MSRSNVSPEETVVVLNNSTTVVLLRINWQPTERNTIILATNSLMIKKIEIITIDSIQGSFEI